MEPDEQLSERPWARPACGCCGGTRSKYTTPKSRRIYVVCPRCDLIWPNATEVLR